MTNFNFEKMQQIQKELQEKYKEKWSPISPDIGRDKLLWMMIEAGEIADIIKKKGDKKIMDDKGVRNNFIEEMCDTLMYFNDVMLCYGISPPRVRASISEKYQINMERW